MSLPRAMSRPAAGFTLIELMIALMLGMIITGAALTVFVTNRQTYRSTESLDRIQENARTAFELMARDLREGAGNTCGKLPVSNVLNNPAANWYTDWTTGMQGYDNATATPGLAFGTGATSRMNGTDAIDLRSATGGDVSIVPDFSATPNIKVRDASGFSVGDIVEVCDPSHASVFQVTGIQSGNFIVHATGTTPVPGNSAGLAYTYSCRLGNFTAPGTCDSGTWPATLARVQAVRWYVGNNDHGTRSLFRTSLVNNGGNAGTRIDEIAEGVQDLQLQFLLDGAASYVDPGAITAADWQGNKLTAVRIALAVADSDRTGTDGNPLTRNIEHTVTFRNRTP